MVRLDTFKFKGTHYWFCEEIKEAGGKMFNQEIILTSEECQSIIDMNNGFSPKSFIMIKEWL